MTMPGSNDDVIQKLKQIITQLEARRTELHRLERRPGGPVSERADRQAEILERASSINLRIHNLRNRLTDRELAKKAMDNVPPLSATRRKAMQTALAKVSKSIAAVEKFRAKIALAEAISSAASKAHTSSPIKG